MTRSRLNHHEAAAHRAALHRVAWLLLTVLCLAAAPFANSAQPEPATPEIEGRQLAARLLALRPAASFTNSGVLQLRDANGKRREIPLALATTVTATNWLTSYTALGVTNGLNSLLILHAGGLPNLYFQLVNHPGPLPPGVAPARAEPLSSTTVMSPFAGCDFWLADLGLEFFHWPAQRVVKKEMRRGEWCHVLESVNPQPAPGAYTRVLSWIDLDTGGILHADAYAQGKQPVKVFEPKKFQKVNGRWEVKSLEIRNERDNTRTTLLFDLPAK